MEELAWRYVERGDIASAERLFQTLARTFSYARRPSAASGGHYQRYLRLCRIVMDPRAVPASQRGDDAVEALLEERFPFSAFFSSSSLSNTSTLNTWFLLVHPDKNSHPRAREAFVRLMSMKERLAAEGLLSAAGIELSPQLSPTNSVKTPIPTVVNERRLEREQRRRQGELDGLLKSLSGKRRVRLQCNLAASGFERALGARDGSVAGGMEDRGLHDSVLRSAPSAHIDEDDGIDDLTLTRTLVLEGLSHTNLSESARKEILEVFPSSTVSNRPVGPHKGQRSSTHRIVLRRPPTLDEWRLEQQELTGSSFSPGSDSRMVHDAPAGPSPSVGVPKHAQPCRSNPLSTRDAAKGATDGDRAQVVLPDVHSRSRVVSPAAAHAAFVGTMKEFVIPLGLDEAVPTKQTSTRPSSREKRKAK